MATTIRIVILLSFLLIVAACQPAATPEQQLRDRLTAEFVDASFGELNLTSSATPEGLKIACQIVLLMDPSEGMLIPPPLAEGIVTSTSNAVQELFPEAIYLNLFVSTWPDIAKYQSPESIDLDGTTLRVGMSKTEIRALLENNEWDVSYSGREQWGLMSRWPRSSKIYFDNGSDEAHAIFLIPVNESASGGGLRVLVANFDFPQKTN